MRKHADGKRTNSASRCPDQEASACPYLYLFPTDGPRPLPDSTAHERCGLPGEAFLPPCRREPDLLKTGSAICAPDPYARFRGRETAPPPSPDSLPSRIELRDSS